MQQKRKYLLLALLLLIFISAWFILKKEKAPMPALKLQGSTTISDRNPVIKIWDYSAVDGDTIDFYFDDELIFKNLGLEDSPKVYKPERLSKGEHTIKIIGVDEGMMGSASPHLSITNGKEQIEFDVDAWEDSLAGSWTIIVN